MALTDTITSTDFWVAGTRNTITSAKWNAHMNLFRGSLIPIDGSVSAASDNNYNLGSASYRWKNVHMMKPFFYGVTSSSSSTYSCTSSDYFVQLDPSGGTITATLPPIAGCTGSSLIFNHAGTANTLLLDGSGSEQIEDTTTAAVYRNQTLELYNNGSKWKRIACYSHVITAASKPTGVDWAHITGSTATIDSQSGAISSVSRSAAGIYTINFASGFTEAPAIAVYVENTAAVKWYYAQNAIGTSSASIRFSNAADSANVDANFSLIMIGSR